MCNHQIFIQSETVKVSALQFGYKNPSTPWRVSPARVQQGLSAAAARHPPRELCGALGDDSASPALSPSITLPRFITARFVVYADF